MYHIYNTDTFQVHKVRENDLLTFLEWLESTGAVLSLDKDNDITYNIGEGCESTAIDELMIGAKNHKRNW